jgi:hypothetical protein
VVGRQPVDRLVQQAALADAGAAAEDQPALGVGHGHADQPGQLAGAADEPPVFHPVSISRFVTFLSRPVPPSRMSKRVGGGE